MTGIDRRQFLKLGGAGAALAAMPGLHVAAASGSFTDYRALVCVFLFGGNDSFNMLVPRSDAEYNAYAASRQNLAIPQADLLPIEPLVPDGAAYGLHPSMPEIRTLFESGRAAFVTNVGPLIEPVTKSAFLEGSAVLPPQLFSHNDQQDQWHSSLFGNTLFQSAAQTVGYVMGPQGPVPFEGFGDSGIFLEQRRAFERIIAADYPSIYERGFADVKRRAVEAADRVSTAIDSAPALATVFPPTQLGTQLETVARLIAVRDELAMQRQIFFVATGGFDTHDDQAELQPSLLAGVSQAMAAFHAATAELGVAGNVTAFTQSDFGRTLTSNGDGTDHAWGGIQLVVGDSVRGRELYGSYPLLEIGGPEDVGGGRMIPSVSADQYAATLARWFGIGDGDLASVAPNLGNFVERDLGFLL